MNEQFRYPLLLLIVHAVAFTVLPPYMIGMAIWAIVQGRMNWWALLFWIILTGLFFLHGIACVAEVRRRWHEPSNKKGKQ